MQGEVSGWAVLDDINLSMTDEANGTGRCDLFVRPRSLASRLPWGRTMSGGSWQTFWDSDLSAGPEDPPQEELTGHEAMAHALERAAIGLPQDADHSEVLASRMPELQGVEGRCTPAEVQSVIDTLQSKHLKISDLHGRQGAVSAPQAHFGVKVVPSLVRSG